MSKTKNEAKYLAVKELHETKNYSIQWMCKVLNIQRSAYYKWLNRAIPENEQENMELAEIIKKYHQKYRGGGQNINTMKNMDYSLCFVFDCQEKNQ